MQQKQIPSDFEFNFPMTPMESRFGTRSQQTCWTQWLEKTCGAIADTMYVQSEEHRTFAFEQLQLEQSPLQEHLTSSLHAVDTWEMVIHTGSHVLSDLLHPNPFGDGT